MTNEMQGHTYSGEFQSAIARAKKILIAAGFPWSVTSGRYTPFFNTQKTTGGVKVHRIGCSETIGIHVADPMRGGAWSASGNEDRRLINALAIATLREAGMPFDDRGWLACGKDAIRAGAATKAKPEVKAAVQPAPKFTVKHFPNLSESLKWAIQNSNNETVARAYCAQAAEKIAALMNADPTCPDFVG